MSEARSSIEPPLAAGTTPPAARRSGLGVIFLTLFLDLAGFSIIFPLSPKLLTYYLQLEGREGTLGKVMAFLEWASPLAKTDVLYNAALLAGVLGSAYSLLQFVAAPFWGSLSDRTGRKPILLISNAGIALSYLLWAVSGSFILFIASRFLAGAMGGNLSVATAAAADASSREDRSKAMGIVGAAFGLGFILGPAIGAVLSLIDLPQHFPALTRYGLNPFSAAALGAFGLALTSVLWVATRFQETLPPELRGTGRVERRTINPLQFFKRFDYPGVRTVNVITFLYLLAFGGMEFTLTFLATKRFDFTPRDNMWLFVFVGTVMALVQGGLVRRLAPRFGERKVVLWGLLIVIPGFLAMGLGTSPFLLYVGLLFMGVGSGFLQTATTSLVSLYAPPDRQGGVLGIFRSLGSFSRAVGPLLATVLFWRLGESSPYLLGALILLPPIAMALTLPAPEARG
jgi:MFS family permease